MKKLLIVAAIVVVVVIVALVIIPSFIDANKYRPEIESKISAAVGRKVTIGNLALSILSGSVRADNISIADDPAFSKSPFVQAKQLSVGVRIWPLITSRQLEITSLTLQEPDVNLIQDPKNGRWNFSSIGKSTGTANEQAAPANAPAQAQSKPATHGKEQAQSKPPANQPAQPERNKPAQEGSSNAASQFSVGSLAINNGRISLATVGGKPHQYTGVNVTAKNVSYTSRFPFTVDADTPGGGKAKLDGQAGPVDQQDAALTPLDANVNITNLNVAQTGFVPPDAGISGLMDFNGKLVSNSGVARSDGQLKAQKLQVVKNGSPSSIPITVDYATDYDLRSQAGKLNKGDIHLGNGLAHLTGTYNLKGASPDVHMNLNGQGIPIPDITGLLPAVGVSLPSGSSLQGGTASANLNFNGLLDRLVTTGALHVDNTKLAGFSMGSQLAAVAKLAGIQQTADTTVKLLATDVNMNPDGTHLNNINLIVPELGTVTGAGVISPNNALNFNLVAKLSGVATSAMGSAEKLVGVSGNGVNLTSLPFKVEGTTSKPVFIPNIGGLVAGGAGKQLSSLLGGKAGNNQNQNNPTSAVQNALGGLLGKKQPK
jgi:AsmA protein